MTGRLATLAKSRLWAALGIVLLSLLWGYTWVVAKQALDYAPPFSMAFIRVFGGAMALFLALKLMRQPLTLPAPRAVFLISLCQVTGFMILQTLCLKFGSAGKTAVLVYTMPIWTLLLAWPILGERVRSTAQWGAVSAILTGLVFIIEPWNLQSGWQSNAFGVGAAVCWALGTVQIKRLRRTCKISMLSLTAWSYLMGSIPVALIAGMVDEPPVRWVPEFVLMVLVLVCISTAFCWWLWTSILDLVPAWEASLLVLGTPVIAIISSRLILHEAFSTIEITGILLIVAGLLLLSFVGWLLERRLSSAQVS